MQTRYLLAILALVALAACSGGGSAGRATPSTLTPAAATRQAAGATLSTAAPGIVAPSGYTVSLFATGSNGNTRPDAIFAHGHHVFVAYQNTTTPTDTSAKSTLVEYDGNGTIVKTNQVVGRCDGMRYNPYTHLIWLTVNEDGNSSLYTWNPSSNALQHFAFSAATHGGGYDDLAFTNGKAFIAASNPTLAPDGSNPAPAIVSVVLNGSTAQVTPVLYGNATARDVAGGKTVTLTLTDPDSLTVDPRGNLVLISQGDKEIVNVRNAGTDDQRVTSLATNTELDDTVWSTDRDGTLFVVDEGANKIYTVRGPLTPETIYTETPSDSSLNPGIVGIVDDKTGVVTPLLTGFSSPSGLIFVSGRDWTDDSSN